MKMPVKATCPHCCTRTEGLTVKLGGSTIIDNIDLHFNCGEVLAVIGPNGAGKTTLLKTMLGEIPYQGRIGFQLAGKPSARPRIGYVPQKLAFDTGSPVSVEDLAASAICRRPVWSGIGAGGSKKICGVLSSTLVVSPRTSWRVGSSSAGSLRWR